MNIIIECDCGNKVMVPAPLRKYTQLRDWLETQNFSYDGEEVLNGKLQEFRIRCNHCKSWITLGVN